jgi:hypothetical protein
MGGPLGNRPQRGPDPVTGRRNSVPAPWSKTFTEPFDKDSVGDVYFMAKAKQCYCHNYGAGLAGWYCITGDRDALHSVVDSVEQQYDTQRRAFKKVAGETNKFSRDFTRATYHTMAARLILPEDPFVVEVSEWLADVFLQRPNPERRGLIVPADPLKMSGFGAFSGLEKYVGQSGIDKMRVLGVTMSQDDGLLTDPKSGAKWYPVVDPHTWMYPPMSTAMDCYYRITGDEDAHDWLIAYGQAVAHVLFQHKHGNLDGRLMVDFPVRGRAWDYASWQLPADSTTGEGIAISGYLARWHPDVCARAYSLSGDPFLKQRALDYWYYGSHRGYKAKEMSNLGRVGKWANVTGVHDETVRFSGRTFLEWARPRQDALPPENITDLRVAVQGNRAVVTFTAPGDNGGGKIARYQVKCAENRILGYADYLDSFNAHAEKRISTWWLADNIAGEPAPGSPGRQETFILDNVPEGARYFAIRSYDDSKNRSALSNVTLATSDPHTIPLAPPANLEIRVR